MTNTKKIILSCLVICCFSFLPACGSSAEATPTLDPIQVMTEVAATIQADITQAALLTPSATLVPPPTPTSLPLPTQQLTLPPPGTSPAAQTVPSSDSPDKMLFLLDITFPDGTDLKPGERFTKTWSIENSGTTTWDSSYKLVYWDSQPVNFPMPQEDQFVIPIIHPVEPGNQLQLSVKMIAPEQRGTFVNYFRLLNGEGEYFGNLYVQIQVLTEEDQTPTPKG